MAQKRISSSMFLPKLLPPSALLATRPWEMWCSPARNPKGIGTILPLRYGITSPPRRREVWQRATRPPAFLVGHTPLGIWTFMEKLQREHSRRRRRTQYRAHRRPRRCLRRRPRGYMRPCKEYKQFFTNGQGDPSRAKCYP